MSYNWIKADTAEGRERLKELLDKGNFVIAKKGFGPNRLAELSVSLCKNEYMVNGKTSPMPFDDLVYLIEDGEFLDPNPIPACPPLRWEKINAVYSANVFGAKFRCSPIETSDDDRWMAELFIGCRLVPVGDDNFETLEDAKSACEAIWASNWEQEMGRMQPWPES